MDFFIRQSMTKFFAFKLKDLLIDNFIFRNVIVINKVNLNNIYSIFMILSMGGLVIKYGIIESKQNSFIKEYKKIFLKFLNRMKINSNKKITDKELRAYIIRSTKK